MEILVPRGIFLAAPRMSFLDLIVANFTMIAGGIPGSLIPLLGSLCVLLMTRLDTKSLPNFNVSQMNSLTIDSVFSLYWLGVDFSGIP